LPPSPTPKTNPNEPNYKNRTNARNLLSAKNLQPNLPFLPPKKQTQNEPNSKPIAKIAISLEMYKTSVVFSPSTGKILLAGFPPLFLAEVWNTTRRHFSPPMVFFTSYNNHNN
jgi:hypothetical protein